MTEIPTIIVTPCVGAQKLHEQGARAAGRSRSESDDLSFQLFSTVGSEGTVTLFPTTAERALCEVHKFALHWLAPPPPYLLMLVFAGRSAWEKPITPSVPRP